MHPGRYAHGLRLTAGLAIAYIAAAWLSRVFEVGGEHAVTAAWPASGLVLGVLLAAPPRRWPAILLTVAFAHVASSLSMGQPWGVAAAFALVDTFEGALAAALVLRAIGRPPELTRLRDVVVFLVVAVGVSNAVSAVGGAAVAARTGLMPFGAAWLAWWLSNGVGMLLVAPLVLCVVQRRLRLPGTVSGWLELVGMYAVLMAVSAWVFWRRADPSVLALPYLAFPALLWAAMRFGPFHACMASLTVAITAGWGAMAGRGPFVVLAAHGQESLALQAFLLVISVSALIAAAVVEDRRRTEESLAAYQQFTEHAADAMLFVRAADARILDANPAASAAYGYTLDELRALRLQDLVAPELIDRANERLRMAAAGGLLVESLHRRKDGTLFPVEVNAKGATVRGELVLLSVHRDLTRRKRAETESARAQRRFRAVFENARDGIMLSDAGVIVEANAQAERLFGTARGGLVGRRPEELSPDIQPDGRLSEAVVRDYVRMALSGTTQYFEWTHRREDGTTFETEVGVSAVEIEGRRMLVGIVRDLSDRRALESQLRQAQKMEAVGRLAGGVAHDFNNLLTVIKGYNELAMAGLTGRPERESLAEVARAADRASGLTRQLLAFSRKQLLEPVLLDPSAIVADMDRMLRRLIGEDVELLTIAAGRVWPIYADRGQIEQVLLNLAVNGRDAMPHGGRLTIETGNAELDEAYTRQRPDVQPGPYVLLSVTDTGVGMSAEVQAHVFEPFFTTKERGKGTGLGLSTAYGIVRQSGGHVTFESAPGRGTTFRVYLPAASRPEAVQVTRQPVSDVVHGRETVLLVEDDPAVRGLAHQLLKRWGYRVLVAPGGAEAISLSRGESGTIDLLLTDVVMPRMGGHEVAAQLTSERPGLRVLFMSGYTENAIVQHGVLEPGVHLIPKPFSPDALGRRIREVLEA